MKQVLINRGKVLLRDVPAPIVEKGHVLVDVAYSLISTGTEISNLQNSGKPILKKALEQSDSLTKLLSYWKKNGVARTITKVMGQDADSYIQTGYSCSGIAIAIGDDIKDIKPGDKVACSGSGIANHAELVLAPRNLVTKIPEGGDLKGSSSVTLGGIALQGVRRADNRLGDIVAVIGLGLLGQITVQLLKIAGCHVIGIDIDPRRTEIAMQMGAEFAFVSGEGNLQNEVLQCSSGYGVDATIITAGSKSDDIIQQAMEITRKKGKVVVVGAVGLNIKRSPFYEKEIDLLISCSYGPGRYDNNYEKMGIDYPYAYVRWTENRNMTEYLSLLSRGTLKINPLIEREYSIENASEAFTVLQSDREKPLAVVINYGLNAQNAHNHKHTITAVENTVRPKKKDKLNVAIVGAGGFATGVHLPNLNNLTDYYKIRAIVSSRGATAESVAEAYHANYATTNYQDVLDDKETDLVLISTRHHLHSEMAIRAARAGKAIFLEKPMAINQQQLDELVEVLKETQVPFSVGFNRRYSPAAQQLGAALASRKNPIMVNYRVNAGFLPLDHWTQTSEGGGRIIGEACHMIDLFRYFIGSSRIAEINVMPIRSFGSAFSAADNVVTSLLYEDGSVCNLLYTALGNPGLSKEYIEVFFDGKTAIIDDFRGVHFYGGSAKSTKTTHQDKGHVTELVAFAEAMEHQGGSPIAIDDLYETTQASFIIANQ